LQKSNDGLTKKFGNLIVLSLFSTDKGIKLLDAINNIYSDFLSYGCRRIHSQLLRDGHSIGKKFVKKAMKYMGIEALYPKPKTTVANKEHYKYEYLSKCGALVSLI